MGNIEFKCDSCGQQLIVDDKDAGTKVICPKCKATLSVPYRFECSLCGLKRYVDFARCPRCGKVGPGPLGDRIVLLKIGIACAVLAVTMFTICFLVSNKRKAKLVEAGIAAVEILIAQNEIHKACDKAIQTQAIARRFRYKEDEISETLAELRARIEEKERQERLEHEREEARKGRREQLKRTAEEQAQKKKRTAEEEKKRVYELGYRVGQGEAEVDAQYGNTVYDERDIRRAASSLSEKLDLDIRVGTPEYAIFSEGYRDGYFSYDPLRD